jgi:hypothetical protein
MNLKKIFSSPYPYIFLVSYFGVLLVWSYIKLPAHNPSGIISHLTIDGYNPTDNIIRFWLAILVPPVACLGYWLISKNTKLFSSSKSLRKTLLVIIALLRIFLASAMGMVQSSTNPANNPRDPYGKHDNYLVDTFHEGETLGPAVSYQQKDLKPYTDFVVIHGVAQDPLRSVAAFKLFGRSIGAERTLTTLLIMLTFVIYYLLLLVLFKGNLIKAAAGMIIMAFFVLPGGTLGSIQKQVVGVQLPFRDITTMAFLAFGVLSLRYSVIKKEKYVALFSVLVGFVVTASYAVSVDRAIYITILGTILTLMLWVILGKNWLKAVLLPIITGLVLGFMMLFVALKGDVSGLFHYLVTISRYKDYLDGEEFLKPNFAYSTVLLALSASIAVAGAWFISRVRAANTKSESIYVSCKIVLKNAVLNYHTEVLLGLTALLFMRSAIGRADIGHFIYSVQWLYLFLAYIAINYFFSAKYKTSNLLKYLTIVSLIFMTALYAGQVYKLNVRRDVFPLHVSDADLVRPDYLQTADFLKQNLDGQDTFATLTSEGIWYYLVNKPSPIKYPIIWYAFTQEERENIANSLDNNSRIKYIVTNNNWTSNFDFVPNPQRFPEVYKVLYEKYQPLTGFGQQTVWIRR